ncbi:MAG: hypothetical protein R2912_09040 [Eubacteriales bacterium]
MSYSRLKSQTANADYPMSDVMITYNGTAYDVLHGANSPSGSA